MLLGESDLKMYQNFSITAKSKEGSKISYLTDELTGVRICEIFSNKSSLKDLARLASLLFFKLPFCPEPTVLLLMVTVTVGDLGGSASL